MFQAIRDILERFGKRKKGHEEIRLEPVGFAAYRNAVQIIKIRWDDITEIVAFKRDLFTTDLVCFEFHTSNNWTFETNEEVEGFPQLVKQLEQVLPTFDRNWPAKVIQPPFAPDPTVIYRRE